ncbi:MAG: DUF3298 and DUF4163 domain-containing protein [Lachnospiraceae bacterium]|nr:DUF3298 and DUF4163 domain-containing protein [Lachnospiraceae bacterium]
MKKNNVIRHIMSKSLSYALSCTLLLGIAAGCTACGTDTGNASDSNMTSDSEGNDTQQSTDITDSENNEQIGENAPQDNSEENPANESDTYVTSEPSHITIKMTEEENNKSAEDGTVYLYKSSSYPTVSIEGNEAAADKINADISSRVESFNANTEVEEWGKEYLDMFESEQDAFEKESISFTGYDEELSFQTKRADSNVISFTMTYSAYTGGAHGNYDTIGINYNAKTGDLIAFSDLSDDDAAFHEDTLAYNQNLAKTEYYKERMFSEDNITDGTLESVLYADDAWYLSTSGLVFMSGPYALGPFAAGIIEFIIPYGDLADMGFHNAYTYADRFVRKLLSKETYHYDLNNDGTEDSILVYTEDSVSEDGTFQTMPHLIINDTDFAQSEDETIQTQLAQSFTTWPETPLFLYDLVPDDSYVELMLVSGEYENDEYVYYSYFYRYQEDGSLTYLGKAKGDANDPTVDTSMLTVSNE